MRVPSVNFLPLTSVVLYFISPLKVTLYPYSISFPSPSKYVHSTSNQCNLFVPKFKRILKYLPSAGHFDYISQL